MGRSEINREAKRPDRARWRKEFFETTRVPLKFLKRVMQIPSLYPPPRRGLSVCFVYPFFPSLWLPLIFVQIDIATLFRIILPFKLPALSIHWVALNPSSRALERDQENGYSDGNSNSPSEILCTFAFSNEERSCLRPGVDVIDFNNYLLSRGSAQNLFKKSENGRCFNYIRRNYLLLPIQSREEFILHCGATDVDYFFVCLILKFDAWKVYSVSLNSELWKLTEI